jgi:hypothetical protein
MSMTTQILLLVPLKVKMAILKTSQMLKSMTMAIKELQGVLMICAISQSMHAKNSRHIRMERSLKYAKTSICVRDAFEKDMQPKIVTLKACRHAESTGVMTQEVTQPSCILQIVIQQFQMVT